MGKEPVVKGQITITTLDDAYHISQSVGEYVFPALSDGTVADAVTVLSTVKVSRGNVNYTDFTIGVISKPAGFSSIVADNVKKTVTYMIPANTTTLADHGSVVVPVIIGTETYRLSFQWAKAKSGSTGRPGTDANLLDWVKDWDTGKTQISGTAVITPKIFTGIENPDGTLTGTAIGHFVLNQKNASGSIIRETIDGIYGFKDGCRTFFVDNGGNVQLGQGEQFIKYNALTGKVEFGSGVSLNWSGATYIDKDGIFTGTLSAQTINALQLNASQITSGTISADRIDVTALKASLITAGNIEALTLKVTKGTVGGWTIDSDSIYRGSKNNASGNFTGASGAVTLGSNGLRGFKWRLEATGAGAFAGGNISWDTSGNLTFGSAVTLLWRAPIDSITTALGGTGYPKVTQITAAGIYTGSVTAGQITSGTISADRIASGSINAGKLDAASIKSSIINTSYINGLSCTFVQGKIGGWTIGPTGLTGTHIALDNGNKRIVVYGANSGVTSGQRVQLHYTSDTDFGLYATDASGNSVAQLGSANKIAGWIFNSSQIYKNNVYLGSDGSISNGNHWKLNNDGSGQIANGGIAWNASGTVTFSSSVSLNWTNLINNIQVGGRNYARNTSCEWWNFSGFTNIANQCILSYTVYCTDWKAGETFTVSFDYKYSGLKSGGNKLISLQGSGNVTGWSSGFSGASLLPYINWTSGTGEFHICYSFTLSAEQAKNASFSLNFRHDYITGGTVGVRNFKIEKGNKATAWSAAPEDINGEISSIQTALGGNSYPKLTKINASGIYTGTLIASQISSGTISADRIAAGSLHSSKLDAASIKANIINTDYINGLSCTFVRGKIGGFTIGSDTMSVGSIGSVGATPLQIRSASSGSGYWYSGAYKPFGVVLTWYQNANAGHIVFGQIAGSGNSVKTGFIGIQMLAWDNTEYFCLSANYTKSGSKEVYNRIAGWAFDNTRIWKNNVSLGSDGSVYNGEKWRLNNDGSGKIANGNISWDASGAVTFSSTVALNWNNVANSGKLYAKGTGLNHSANRSVILGGTQIVNSGSRGLTLVVINRSNLSVVSNTNYDVYSSDTNCNALASALNALGSDKIVVLTSFDAISINGTLNTALQRCGGSNLTINNSRSPYVLIGIPTIGKDNGLVSVYGTGTSEPYAEISTVIINGIPQGINVLGKQKTYIDGNGIYAGTINASQINAGTISADRIAAGSINSSKLDANSIKANIINAGYINGLSCAFVRGTIGGWSIGSNSIAKNSVTLGSDGTISNGSYWSLNRDGSGKLANGNITWDTSGNTAFKGKLTSTSGNIGGFEIGSNRIGTANDPSNPNQNSNGMFLYNSMVGFNATGRQSIIGCWDNLGIDIQCRLVNTKSSYTTKYGQIIDIEGGLDRESNVALSIVGGTVGGLCPHTLVLTAGRTFSTPADLRKYNSIVWIWNNSNITFTLPTMRIQDHGYIFKFTRVGGGTKRNNVFVYPKSGQPIYAEEDRYFTGYLDTLYSGNDCLLFQFIWGVSRSGYSDTGIWIVNKLPRTW